MNSELQIDIFGRNNFLMVYESFEKVKDTGNMRFDSTVIPGNKIQLKASCFKQDRSCTN